jgi:glycosyltransferase involved in cell wall biosynthesis
VAALKIVQVTGSFPPQHCGVGDYTERLALALSRRGLEVAVLTSTASGASSAGREPRVLRRMPDWQLRRLPMLLRFLRGEKPDVVHLQYPTRGYGRGLLPMFLPMCLSLLGYRLVQTWHEEMRARHWPEFLLKALAPSALVVVRPSFLAHLPALFQRMLGRRTLHFIANGSPLPTSNPATADRAALREGWLQGARRLVVFSGFIMPGKGVELLFEIADPGTDRLVIAGECVDEGLRALIESKRDAGPWNGRVTLPGFLPPDELALLLSLADAVVLPFRAGGGVWNSSIHGAAAQGSFVLSTSRDVEGYDAARNIHFARIDDVAGMRAALAARAGTRREPVPADAEWDAIAGRHADLYHSVLPASA